MSCLAGKHDITKPSVKLCPISNLLFPRPRKISIVHAHNAICDLTTDAKDDGPNNYDGVDDSRVSPSDIPLPERVKIQLLTKCHPENKVTSHRMRNVRKFPRFLSIPLGPEH